MFKFAGVTVREAQELHVAGTSCVGSFIQLSAPDRSTRSAWIEHSFKPTKLGGYGPKSISWIYWGG
jgi:hypothetical protein